MNLEQIVPDTYLRYKIGFDFIKQILGRNTANILDVGGAGGLLAQFVKKEKLPYKLIIIDPRKDNQKLAAVQTYIQADFLKYNFSHQKFDIVTNFDVLEHIKKKQDFIDKIFTLSNNLILSAPFYSNNVLLAEKTVNSFFKKYKKINHPWLSEHTQSKLPRTLWLENYLNKKKLNFNKINFAHIPNWSEILMLSFIPNFGKLNQKQINLLNQIFQFYNQNYQYLNEFNPPCYRTLYIVSDKKIRIPSIPQTDLSKILKYQFKINSFLTENFKYKKFFI